MTRLVLALLAGALFGAGLHLSGMTDTQKVLGFLDIFGGWDPTLMFVMGGAILPMFVAWRFTRGRKPVVGDSFPQPPADKIDANLVIGAILFGLGWGTVGLCPGPAIASLTYGGSAGWIFFAAMLAGMALAPRTRALLDRATA